MSAISTTLIPTGTWAIDPSHSTVGFSVKHLGIANVRGSFGAFGGTLEVGDDLSTATIATTIETASITTAEPQRDEHLRSPDFFDAASHPEITFRATGITPKDDQSFQVSGELTMRGVTQPVTLDAVVNGLETDPWGNERVGIELAGSLSRGAFGMTFNQALGSGNMLVSDKVRLALDVSAVRQSA